MAVSALFVLIFSSHGGYAQCGQNNFAVTELYFLDENGKAFDPAEQTIGATVAGRIYARFSGSSTNAFFPLHFAYTEEIGGTLSSSQSVYCITNTTGTSTNHIPKDQIVFLFNYTMVWGNEIFFKDIYMTWRTNDGQTTCRTNNASGQCFSSPEGLRVSTGFDPLPVLWGKLSASHQVQDNSVELSWETYKEWESSHFEIQRSEEGIKNFQTIGQVDAMGWSDITTNYYYKDHQIPPHAKRLYYRILQIDLDGTKDYSKTMRIDNKQANSRVQHWQVFPNPMQDNSLQLNFRGERIPDQVEIRIFALSSNKKITIQPSERHTEIGHLLQDFPKGVLIMEVVSADTVENFKIIKK